MLHKPTASTIPTLRVKIPHGSGTNLTARTRAAITAQFQATRGLSRSLNVSSASAYPSSPGAGPSRARAVPSRNPEPTHRALSTTATLRRTIGTCRRDTFVAGWGVNSQILASTRVGVLGKRPASVARFHSTPRREGAPIIPFLAVMLKATTSLELLRMLGRVAFTFTPFLLIKNFKARRDLRLNDRGEIPPLSDERMLRLTKRMRHSTIALHFMFSIPFLLFWAMILASMERTPLTGRWRLIILSPEEEEELAEQLKGPGWYQAVDEILSKDGPPRIIHDWRYTWVRDTLRRLEAIVPILQNEAESLGDDWASDVVACANSTNGSCYPRPPPAEYPLNPRPRAAEEFKKLCEMICEKKIKPTQKLSGPPYSLLVVEKPEAANAFSYGFGEGGCGGIVVYSGFLDEILAASGANAETSPAVKETSAWDSFWGSLTGRPAAPSHPIPTKEQTTKLAVLLAHELSHLLLAHHLESLSSSSVMYPGIASILSDVARVVIFPFTALFGPFVNDALAQLSKVGFIELSKMGEYCNSMAQEIEADVVSARLLAHAGFDPREAVQFWEERSGNARAEAREHEEAGHCHTPHGKGPSRSEQMAMEQQLASYADVSSGSSTHSSSSGASASASSQEPTAITKEHRYTQSTTSALGLPSLPALPALRILGNTHPVNATRVNRLKLELMRWETERRALRYRREVLGIRREDEKPPIDMWGLGWGGVARAGVERFW